MPIFTRINVLIDLWIKIFRQIKIVFLDNLNTIFKLTKYSQDLSIINTDTTDARFGIECTGEHWWDTG